MIRIQHLSKTFGGTKKQPLIRALDNVSLELRDGEITGLLGLNGAGKSTLMRLIYGLLEPSAGDIVIDGLDVRTDPDEARKHLGVLPDDTGLYKRLTSRENIRYFGELQGLRGAALEAGIEQLIGWLGMETIADRRAEGFSLGERMKTALARALVHQPKHVLLDEPTNGLDVITTRSVRRLLHELKDQGRCVLFSSHLMHEVSGLCDRILVIAQGRICADGNLAAILETGQASNLEDAFVNLVQTAAKQEADHVAA
ncbi:ABC transporter ATP-binding protein [Cellvibrio japonicus]|uniref:Sodium ABC transporter ATP-binding protein n=1 Tax=Cellvibrio japonicus (strain Ueda107) TaxID=498211 RepID=B3PJJ7_CELJU|nr:ATP-binding cassette domain-containing protein [Cellvibrio japonicus]ACE84312.1 sodium ABC transporter ATP-binding protein [Cellvibrio japonicus Ueda107]QEI11283.1 ATP-binding cassette domain-containing protein [Cellvibrio japonicus]QEI14857.1 ATP-binding cassette domain-containing protein [Cellvibrio japonicus]QEI18437.1 ATP-binding cassette domain-containing protein [Cellvibrio japonicus]